VDDLEQYHKMARQSARALFKSKAMGQSTEEYAL
jgi:hypothetical protein